MDYNTLSIIHFSSVIAFLLIYLIKTPLLLLNKTEALGKFTKATKVPEMIISLLFLVSGVWMLTMLPVINTLLIIKIVIVLLSIPIAIVGFKKGNKFLAALALIMIIGAYGLAEASKGKRERGSDIETVKTSDSNNLGKTVYEAKCVNCHGPAGNAGVAGAKDLTVTTMGKDEIKAITKNGKGMMPPVELTEEQLDAVAEYVQSLKK